MDEFTEYITKTGDRMDNISFQAYGNPFRIGEIFKANPTVPIQDVYPAGIRLLIPIQMQAETTNVPSQFLPPWKQS